MAGETPITVVGNLTDRPEMRYTQQGRPVANFSVASTPRRFDKGSGQWVDGTTAFHRCTVWGRDAENLVESAGKGDRVIVVGRLEQREFTDREGQDRRAWEIQVDEVAISTKFRIVRSYDNRQQGGGQQRQQRDDGEQWASQRQRGGQQRQQREQYDDPWGSAPPPGSGPYQDDEPPF
jgi:single-strand DNA-binding protein